VAAKNIAIDADRLAEFCRRNHIVKLSLFGSALRDDFDDKSDVDLLVEFDKNAHVGYFDLARMEFELTDLIGRKVDLRTPAELSRYFRDEVLATAQPQYVS
jgi:uncharacterized protein